jgi:hypothetical protein
MIASSSYVHALRLLGTRPKVMMYRTQLALVSRHGRYSDEKLLTWG